MSFTRAIRTRLRPRGSVRHAADDGGNAAKSEVRCLPRCTIILLPQLATSRLAPRPAKVSLNRVTLETD